MTDGTTLQIGQRSGETNTGRKRRRNEDAFVCDPPLFAVADGMGGAQAGELASSLAAAALTERGDSDAGGEARVVELVQEANRRIHQRALDDATVSGMGTTITVALVGKRTVTIGHVGDSRAYMLRKGRLEQLTDDHSLVAELVRRGELSPEEAEVHPQRSVITRALGTDPHVDVDAFGVEAQAGDVFLLCSDGLTTMVDAAGIAELVEQHRDDLQQATKGLIDAANARGGDDNITAVLFELVDGSNAIPPPAQSADDSEEDTLHPEDRVAAPVVEPGFGQARSEDAPPAVDTMVVAPEQAQAARAALAAPEQVPAEPVTAGEQPLPVGRMVLSSLVILALSAAIVFLVMQGLAR